MVVEAKWGPMLPWSRPTWGIERSARGRERLRRIWRGRGYSARRRPAHGEGRLRLHHRAQRRRQVHAHQGDRRRPGPAQGQGALRRSRHRQPPSRSGVPRWHRHGPARTQHVPRHDRLGELGDGCLFHPRPAPGEAAHRARHRAAPGRRGESERSCRPFERRPATTGRDRPGESGRSQAADCRRTNHGPRAASRPARPGTRGSPAPGGHHHPHGRTERPSRAGRRSGRVRHGARPDQAARPWHKDARRPRGEPPLSGRGGGHRKHRSNSGPTGAEGMTQKADIVVAGAGHNSLITAAYLAKAGYSVIVLDARPIPGGGAATEEPLMPGYLIDTCSTGHTLIRVNPLLTNDELGLVGKYGLKYLEPDPGAHVTFPHSEYSPHWPALHRTCEEFARFSKHDSLAYRRMMAGYDEVKGAYGGARFTPPGLGPSLQERVLTTPHSQKWR